MATTTTTPTPTPTQKTVSTITPADIAAYIRLDDPDQADIDYIAQTLSVAKSYIESYTAISAAELDNYSDMVIVVYVLCQDMFDNRTLYVDSSTLNNVVETILNMHARNLL